MKYDFSGWATKANLLCTDGRTIMKNAFKDNDGATVPLVWNHQHNDPSNVLGHALLENREDGVYAYCSFNETDNGKAAKLAVEHGDVRSLSIYANKLKQVGGNVVHGAIREVSLVLAGANPGAFIDSVIRHGEISEDEGVIYADEPIELFHADGDDEPDKRKDEEIKMDKNDNRTVGDVFKTFTEDQKLVLYALIEEAVKQAKGDDGNNKDENKDEEGDANMKHNAFDEESTGGDVLTHAEMEEIFSDAKRYGSLKDSVLAHGITNVELLFPEVQNVTRTPETIDREQTWVSKVMNGTHHTPFSRIKSTALDITGDEARAKGYIKGKQKVEEFIVAMKRTTTPTTIYKKQAMDRDDVLDITDFDVVAYLKTEMRGKLDEEIARAILVGDGRSASSDDKINEQNIRPIWTDSDFYTVKVPVAITAADTPGQKAKKFIQACVRARKDYKGSGNPTMYCTEDILTECLLMEDLNQRIIYETVDKLKSALRVSDIVTVPVMENLTREVDSDTHELVGIMVNLKDYNVGADKGGNVSMFDDFDIDVNKEKYLIETRCSGALVKPYSALAIEFVEEE